MLCFVFAALVVLLDQFFKRWVVITLYSGGEKVIIPGILNLIYVENSGAAFSILPNQRWLLAGVVFVIVLILITILLRYNEGFWGTLGLASVLGGAVGNLIDRVFHGFVVDMFKTTFMDFAIFNIADIFITLGGLTFCVFFIISSARSVGLKEDAPEQEPEQEEEYIEEQYGVNDFPQAPVEELPPEPKEEIDYSKLFYTDAVPDDLPEPDFAPPADFSAPPPDFSEPPAEFLETAQELFASVPEPQVYRAQEPPGFVAQEPPSPARESQGDDSPAPGAVDTLKSELTELVDGYNLDDLLREYGFEDDDKG